MLKLIAFMVCYQGEDFLKASIDSVYNYMDKIIVFCSHVSWKGQTDSIGNTCLSVILEWKRVNDYKDKIVIVTGNWNNQLDHYTYAYNFLKQHYKFDYAMCLDSDEIWDDFNLQKAIQYLKDDNSKHDSFSCKMKTFIKSPYFMIQPTEPCSPVVFMSSNINEIAGVRCNKVKNRKHWEDIKYYHMCYVRVNDESIKRKFYSIQVADGSPSRNDWILNIYNKVTFNNLNKLKNIHPTKGAEHCWHSVIKIDKSDLPIYLQKDPVLLNWSEKTGDKIK